jgi:branched-chain amino acid transport system ATP-binding protein
MVALAKAVLARPRLLLIDELTHGLAPMIARQLFATVRELAAELGAAVLLVEQSVDLALDLADRAIVKRRGVIVMGGTSDELSGLRDELAAHYLGA